MFAGKKAKHDQRYNVRQADMDSSVHLGWRREGEQGSESIKDI